MSRVFLVWATVAALSLTFPPAALRALPEDIVRYAGDATQISGMWTLTPFSDAAGQTALTTPDQGWRLMDSPAAAPAHFFEMTFDAEAGTTYQFWMRLRATSNSRSSDSVWVQFDQALDAGGQPIWAIGTADALPVALEPCSGCAFSGWGWKDRASWITAPTRVQFAVTGPQTLRVQVREDGVAIDQIVLSPGTWLTVAPGASRDDTTIVPKPSDTGTVTMVREPYLQQVTPTSAIVVWATREGGSAAVRYTSGGSSFEVAATSRLVPASTNLMGIDYVQHEARLTGLSPLTTYTYTPRLGTVFLSSGDRFTTAPPVGSGTVRFIAFGDSGIGSIPQRQLATRMAADTFDFGLHTGDVVYGSESTSGAGHYPQLHRWFFDIYRDWLRTRPMYPSIGNHDDEADYSAPYRDVFVLPTHGATSTYPDHAERYYSFDYGAAHVVVLDTERAFQNSARQAAQIAWLRDDLAATTQPWTIAVFHKSPYSAGGEHGSDLAVRAVFSPIFEEFGVDLVLSAHEHVYERTHPIRETAAGEPVVYVVTGGGGARLYPAGTAWWTAASASRYHYVRGTVTECQISLSAVDVEGVVFDGTTLDRCSTPPPGSGTPYGGTAAAIPGRIEAERFDEGANGVAYRDLTAGNSGNAFRATDVDLQATTDAGGGYNVGWMSAGEWLSYSVNVGAAATYTLEARVASSGQGGTFHLEMNGVDITGPVTIPNTGGWQKWVTLSRTGIALNAGVQQLRVVLDSNSSTGVFGNLNYLHFINATSAGGGTPYGGTAAVVPGTVEAEAFDEGGEGIGYHDKTAGNTGGRLRSTDVDIEATTDTGGGHNVGWISAGEWLAYTIDVTSSGTYTLAARVAANGQGGTFHVEIDGADVSGPLAIPNTGGWQKWTTVTTPAVPLSAGRHTLRVVFDTNGPTGVMGNINYLRVAAP